MPENIIRHGRIKQWPRSGISAHPPWQSPRDSLQEAFYPPGNILQGFLPTAMHRDVRGKTMSRKHPVAERTEPGRSGGVTLRNPQQTGPSARSRLPARRCAEHVEAGHLQTRDLKAFLGLMGEVRPEGTRDVLRRDKETRRRGDKGKILRISDFELRIANEEQAVVVERGWSSEAETSRDHQRQDKGKVRIGTTELRTN